MKGQHRKVTCRHYIQTGTGHMALSRLYYTSLKETGKLQTLSCCLMKAYEEHVGVRGLHKCLQEIPKAHGTLQLHRGVTKEGIRQRRS